MPIENRSDAAEIRAAASVLMERLAFLKQAGVTFHGHRDLYEILGYSHTISAQEYRARYLRGGIAKRLVEALPRASWRGGAELVEDTDPKTSTAFEKAWEELEKRLHVWSTLYRADILSGLSSYSVVLIGAPGNFTDELAPGKPEDLIYLTPFLGGGGPNYTNRTMVSAIDTDATIRSLVQDPTNPRFGLPEFYQLRRIDITAPEFQVPVHWSRIVHIAENTLEDEIYGQPTLEACWNLLDDLDKVIGGGAEAFWLRANQGIQLDVDKDMVLDQPEKDALKNQAEEYQHQIRRMLRTRGVTVKELGSDVANFANPADAIITQIAGTKGIPKRILVGAELGELASTQDRENWADQVNGRREGHCGPSIVRPLVDRLIKYGYLPTPKEYNIVWPNINTLTAIEKSDGAAKWAGVNSSFGSVVFTESEIRDHWYGMEPLSAEDEATSLSEIQRAEGADKWALVSKTLGSMVFDPDEIRAKWSDLPPLTDAQKAMPVTAPERVSATAPTPEQDANGKPIPAAPVGTLDPNTGLPKPAATKAVAKPAPKVVVPPIHIHVKAAETHPYSSTQVNLPWELASELRVFASSLDNDALHPDGIEYNSHVTVKYGIESNSVDDVAAVLQHTGPITMTLGKIDVFTAPDYDVLIVRVSSPDLVALNAKISSSLAVTDTHPTYQPHVTLAYLQPGQGARYVGDARFVGRTFVSDTVIFSSADDVVTPISTLAGHAELLHILEAAIIANNTDVIDHMFGMRHADFNPDEARDDGGKWTIGGNLREPVARVRLVDEKTYPVRVPKPKDYKHDSHVASLAWSHFAPDTSKDDPARERYLKAFEHIHGTMAKPTANSILGALTGFSDIGQFLGLEGR